MRTKQMTIWFSTISIILVLWGIVFAFFGLDILPIMNKDILLPWESALYGAIMMGWGVRKIIYFMSNYMANYLLKNNFFLSLSNFSMAYLSIVLGIFR